MGQDVVYIAGEVGSWTWGGVDGQTRGEVYKSTGAGQNWALIWTGDNLARYVWVDPRNTDRLYVSTGIFDRDPANSDKANGVWSGVGIVRSDDGGQTWTVLNEANGLEGIIVPSLKGKYVMYARGGVPSTASLNGDCCPFGANILYEENANMIKRSLLLVFVALLLPASTCALYDTSTQEHNGTTVEPDTEITAPQSAANEISPTTDQTEVSESPATITLEASEATDVRLGIMAIDKLVAPALDGHRLAAELPTDSVLLIQPDGTAFFSYADLFSRHFRSRKQNLQQIMGDEGETFGIEDLLHLPPDVPRPKALLDLHSLDNAEELYFNNGEDILWWTGEIVYKFDLGLPVESFRLSSQDGRRKTVIGDWDWEIGRAVNIFASNDGTNWTEIWRSHGEGGKTKVEAELPAALLGQGTVYLKFSGQDANVLFDLYVSAKLDAGELTSILHLEAGQNQLEFSGGVSSSHNAIIFWEGQNVRKSLANTDSLNYPDLEPQVTESDEAITILFPEQVGIMLQRGGPGQAIAGIRKLFVGQREVLSAPSKVPLPPPSLDILSDDEVGGVTDWAVYLEERQAINQEKSTDVWEWPKRGGRKVRTIELDGAEYLGYRIDEDAVVVYTQVSDGNETAELAWVFSPITTTLGGRDYRGLGWQVKLTGLETAQRLRIVEPAAVYYGDWALAQTWIDFAESRLDFQTPFAVPLSPYFAEIQPFFFTGGPNGAVTSYFDTPVVAKVAVAQEAGRLLNTVQIPLGTGTVRETPMKVWLWAADALPTKWAALDEWTSIYDATANRYRIALGLDVNQPKPTLVWIAPSPDYYLDYLEFGPPETEDLWFYDLAYRKLPLAAQFGMRVMYLQPPWDADAEYPLEEFLPGSNPNMELGGDDLGSGHAPRQLEISQALGGEEGLRELVDRAHALGIKIVLWTPPAHLSNSSPLLQEHPDWLKWRNNGMPETFLYPDITGTSLDSAWFDYVVTQTRRIHEATGIDGVWLDSFLTFGILPDGREPQPHPPLDRVLALQREFWQMGLTEVHIEGMGPFGLSNSYSHEQYEGSPEPIDEVLEEIERIRGREYILYRIVANTLVEPDSYYRTLASKGVVGVANLDELTTLPQDQQARITQANSDYMQVLDKMERRHLIAQGDTWQGVAWTRSGSAEVVLFAFTQFHYPLAGRATIEDITAGVNFEAKDSFETEAMHTYVIR